MRSTSTPRSPDKIGAEDGLSIIVLIYMKIIYIPLKFQVGQFELENKTLLPREVFHRFFFLFFILSLLILTGCAAQKRSCPPLATAAEASAVLREYSSGLKPLRATGSCVLNYTDEKGQTFAQSFPVRVWFESSRKFCLYGDVLFDAKAVCFVVNGDEFWTYARPFGIYVTGKTDAESEDYFSNPAILLDFLEPVDSACLDIALANSKDNSILICKDNRGCVSRKIFIDRCDHFARRIEYFNCSGNPAIVVELDKYKNAAGENFSFPRKLVYRRFEGQKCSDSMQIKIDSVKLWQTNPEQLKALFSPPDVNSLQKSSEHKETN